MKKFLTMILALCLLLTAVGCSKGNDPITTADADFRVWCIESALLTDYATNGQSKWMEEKTGIKIDYVGVPAHGWFNAFQSSVMSGEDIDVYLYEFGTMEATMLGTEMQYIIPLEDYITPENTPNIHAILTANPQLKEAITAPDGHIYTLFANDVYNEYAYTQKLWVNKQFFEKYSAETGKKLPETTAEFEEMLVYFNTHDLNGNGKQDEIPYIGNSGVDGTYFLFNSFIPSNSSSSGFGCYVDDSGKATFAYNQNAFKDALSYIRKLYAQGLIHADTFTTSTDDRYKYTSGDKGSVRAGVVTGVSASDVVKLSSEDGTMTYADYIPLAPLMGPNGVRGIVSTGETTLTLRNAITAKCDDPAKAMHWLDYGYSEEARLYAIHGGLENKAWERKEGQTVTGTDTVISPICEQKENSSWYGQGIVFRVTEDDYLTMDASNLAANSALATYAANRQYRPYMVKNPWPALVWVEDSLSEEANAYTELNGLVQKAVTEYYTAVITGQQNLESDWDAYAKNLDDIGVTRFVELVNLYISQS